MASLTDADQLVIDKLRHALSTGGEEAVAQEVIALSAEDPIRFMEVLAAFYPEKSDDEIRERLGRAGLDRSDISQLVQKLKSTSPSHQ